MLTFKALEAAIRDPEIREKFSKVAARMVAAEIKATRAVAAVTARLSKPSALDDGFLKDIVERHIDFYDGLVERSIAFHQTVIDSLRDADSVDPAESGTGERRKVEVELSSPVGARAKTPFRIANNRPSPVTITCRATPFVSEDGQDVIGGAIAFVPPAAHIEAESSVDFEAIISINTNFNPGKIYLSTIYVEGADALRISLRLEVTEPEDGQTTELDAKASSTNEASSPKKPGKKATSSTASKQSGSSRRSPKSSALKVGSRPADSTKAKTATKRPAKKAKSLKSKTPAKTGKASSPKARSSKKASVVKKSES